MGAQRVWWGIGVLLLAGCSGITPGQHYNHREEGPPGGLFSGPGGAWTIGVGGSRAPASDAQPVRPLLQKEEGVKPAR